MEKITLSVHGMSCGHCEKAVINALEDIGVPNAAASSANNTVELEYDSSKISLDAIKAEIIDCGYTIA